MSFPAGMFATTIHSTIVDLDDLVPRIVDIEREENDVQILIPRIFWHSDIANDEDYYMVDSIADECKFNGFFDDLDSYRTELEVQGIVKGHESSDTGITNALIPSETVILPKYSWRVSKREYFKQFIASQGMMLRVLMKTIYDNLEDIQDTKIHFSLSGFKLKYIIAGETFITRPEGAVTVGPKNKQLPIISYTGWFKGQTWNEFLGETLSVMLGQLAKNIGIQRGDSRFYDDQEVFVIGFHGLYIHIARGFFTANVISRVHLNGCSKNEAFELKFTRGYNLFLKNDWLEAMRALTRLFRYFRSGSPKIRAIQNYLQGN